MALTDVQKVRLRVGDYSDVPYFADSMYEEVISENDDNLIAAAKDMAIYILGILARSTRSKLGPIESYDDQLFKNYRQFLMDTVNNPALMNISPIAYLGGSDEVNPLIQFSKSWNAGYMAGTATEDADDFYNGSLTESL